MPSRARPARFAILVLGSVLAAMPAPSRAEDYRIATGDVIGFDIVGIAGLQRNATVAVDGSVTVPVAGQVGAAGLTLRELRERIVSILAQKSYPGARDASGKESWQVIFPEEVVVDIVEYRPVFLRGDVTTQGRQAYTPGLTVRQSIAAAGGLLGPVSASGDVAVELAAAANAYRDLWRQFVLAEAQTLRLQAEQDGATTIDRSAATRSPLPAATTAQIFDLEERQAAIRAQEFRASQAAVAEVIAQADRRIALLADKRRTGEEALAADEDEFRRVDALLDRGLIKAISSNAARRMVLDSSIRLLETATSLATVQRERIELGRALERLVAERGLSIAAEQQAARARLSSLRAELETAREKLLYLGGSDTLSATPGEREPAIRLVRVAYGHASVVEADLDAALQPGDVVEILRPRAVPSLGLQEIGPVATAVSEPSRPDTAAPAVLLSPAVAAAMPVEALAAPDDQPKNVPIPQPRTEGDGSRRNLSETGLSDGR
ncbi:hypothetical protein ASG48_07310 [Aurantimonas sp. Leaf443]|nr:hypothetical protein ASG48_07310 [Aurantimonas sp. Leaf443]